MIWPKISLVSRLRHADLLVPCGCIIFTNTLSWWVESYSIWLCTRDHLSGDFSIYRFHKLLYHFFLGQWNLPQKKGIYLLLGRETLRCKYLTMHIVSIQMLSIMTNQVTLKIIFFKTVLKGVLFIIKRIKILMTLSVFQRLYRTSVGCSLQHLFEKAESVIINSTVV